MPDPAILVSVSEAVKAMIEAARDSLSINDFELERSYADWKLELLTAESLRVDVVPVYHKQAVDLSGRGKLRYTVPIDVVVRKRIAESEQSDETGRALVSVVDGLVFFCQNLFELFIPQRMASFPVATFQSATLSHLPYPPHLRENKLFTAVIRVTFRAEKAIP